MKTPFRNMIIAAIILTGCTSTSTRENINKVGDAAGQTVGEFVEGVTHGVEKAFDVRVEMPASLEEKGIKFGKTTVTNDETGRDNLLLIYMIFEADFTGEVTAKVFDSKNLEMGRARVRVAGKKDEAKFIEFHFDKRTDIDSDSILKLEYNP